MPLRLKSLELHGYKTFAAKTVFEFAEGITAIVGPNGSGKSNIADALRWVLGEQSYSLLRARRTEDMIFAGSEQRVRAGMASAGVTFDNENGWLPVDFTEVSLARRSYRDGRNEYLLNNQHVRLKDIVELLAQSGLSERTYTILGQGLVDASLALKADERRRLFEEAAGIGLYRLRKDEALRRLETTQHNLDRVLDILSELEPRLKSLERQAARAQEYTQLQADLRILLLEWYGFHWHRTQGELTEALELAGTQEARLTEARESYLAKRQAFATFRDHLNGLRGRLNSWHRRSAQLHESRESISGSLAALDERQRGLQDNLRSGESDQSRLTNAIELARGRLTEVETEAERLTADFEEAESQTQSADSALQAVQANRSGLEGEIQVLRSRVEQLSEQRARLEAFSNEIASRSESQKRNLETIAQAIESAQSEAKLAARDLVTAAQVRQGAESALKKAESDHSLARSHRDESEQEIKAKQEQLSTKKTEQSRLQAQLEVLEQAQQSMAGYTEGAKALLEAARQSHLEGALGALSTLLDVPAEYERAIDAVLGEFTDAVLLDSGQNAEQAMLLLDSDQSSRASLLPLEWINPDQPLSKRSSQDCLGVASDLVTTRPEYRPVVDLLLGQVLVARDRQAARRLLAGQPRQARVVTLRGEVFHATGQVSAGNPGKLSTIGRQREKREITEKLDSISRQIRELEIGFKQASGKLEEYQSQVADRQRLVAKARGELEHARVGENQAQVHSESTRQQAEWQEKQKSDLSTDIQKSEKDRAQAAFNLSANERDLAEAQELLKERSSALSALSLEDAQEQVKYWTTALAVAQRARSDVQSRMDDRRNQVNQLLGQKTDLEKRLQDFQQQLQMLEEEREGLRSQTIGINAQLEELAHLIEPAEHELETSEAHELDLQRQENEGQTDLVRFERKNSQVQLDLGRKQETLEALRQKIEDDFGLVAFDYATDISGPVPLPLEGMVEQLPVVSQLSPDLEDNMTRLRAQLRRIGAINPEARQEYQSVKERFTFLTTQMEDLKKAEGDLHQVIIELDEITRREFQKTFDAVAEQFHTIFHRLFAGGTARLVLTDPDNLTESGIDIEARLPGRREQGLSLLSGGERSLTAIALVFALLKVSPTPVCVMDEVDAMLDEANVGRFRDLLLELSKETQFIIITHNRNTVQAADVIYGVTMGRDSASQIISLKLDEVSEEYLK